VGVVPVVFPVSVLAGEASCTSKPADVDGAAVVFAAASSKFCTDDGKIVDAFVVGAVTVSVSVAFGAACGNISVSVGRVVAAVRDSVADPA